MSHTGYKGTAGEESPSVKKKLGAISIRVVFAGCLALATTGIQAAESDSGDNIATPLRGATKVSIDEEGRLVLNGKPFFLIGLYSVWPAEKLKRARELGFNAVHTYLGEGSAKKDSALPPEKMKAWLDEAAKQGLYAWVGLPRHQIKAKQFERIEERVGKLKDAPSLLFWYLFDEPKLQGVSAATMKEVAERVKKADPNHPRILAPYRNPKGYLGVPDVLLTWAYSVRAKNSDLTPVGKQIRTMRRLVADKKPVWSAIQMHGRGPGGRGFGYLEPEWSQLRNMTYQAVVAGCRGLCFWVYSSSQFHLEKTERGMKNAKRIAGELRTLTPILLGKRPKAPPLNVTGDKAIQSTFFAQGGKHYLLVVNTSYRPSKVTVAAKGGKLPVEVDLVLGDRKIKTDGAEFSESIEPLGVRWYALPEMR